MGASGQSFLGSSEELVRRILISDPKSRDSDTLLLLTYWARHAKSERVREVFRGVLYDLSDAEIMDLPSPSTIRTVRQKIQNKDHDLGPSPQVQEERMRRAEEMRRQYGGSS